jgi:dTMP kinase
MSIGARVKPGTLIVLEGLDRTGKTTQAKALSAALDPAATEHVRMPRGFTCFTDELYTMLESDRRKPASGLARQLAHLACHAESVPRINEILRERAVLLDRWWWSTVAYGWHSGEVPNQGVSKDVFMGLITSIWGSLDPSVIFLFDQPYEADVNNSERIKDGFHALERDYAQVTVRVPPGLPEAVTALIVDELGDRRLLANAG